MVFVVRSRRLCVVWLFNTLAFSIIIVCYTGETRTKLRQIKETQNIAFALRLLCLFVELVFQNASNVPAALVLMGSSRRGFG